MKQLFERVEEFLNTEYVDDFLIGVVKETKFWRVEIVKHNKTGLFYISARHFTVRGSKIRTLYRRGCITLGKIDKYYQDGDTFSILRIPFKDEEDSRSFCYDLADHYRNDTRIALPKKHEYFYKDIPDGLKEIIDGAVAGDGYIGITGRVSSFFAYVISSKYIDHLEELVSELRKYGCESTIHSYIVAGPEKGKEIHSSGITWFLRCFRKHRLRWYRSDGLKKLPDDVQNTSTFWRWFYAGDGCLTLNSRKTPYIRIFSYDFLKEDVDRMKDMLMELGISCSVHTGQVNDKGRTYYYLYIKEGSVKKFLDMTGPPIKGIEYKWDYCRT